MSTGVHHAWVHATIANVSSFFDRKGIHIRAEGNAWARSPPPNNGDHASSSDTLPQLSYTVTSEKTGDVGRSLKLLKRQLRVRVKITPIGDYLVAKRHDFGSERDSWRGRLSRHGREIGEIST